MSQKKIALISLDGKNREILPLGLLYLGTALKNAGHQVIIMHRNISMLPAMEQEINEFQPDLIGMSVFTGYENKNNIDLSRRLKSQGYKIVWGNAHPTLLPAEVLSEAAIEYPSFTY